MPERCDRYGAVQYEPGIGFDIFHHEAFAFSHKAGRLEYNLNPAGDAICREAAGFRLTDTGFSFLRPFWKKAKPPTPVAYQDRTDLERLMTRYLAKWIHGFSFSGSIDPEIATAFDAGWTQEGVEQISLRNDKPAMNWICLARREGELSVMTCDERGVVLMDSGHRVIRTPVEGIRLEENRLIVSARDRELDFPCLFQSDIREFVRDFLKTGFGGTAVRISRAPT